jgi:hypothetical protein
MFGLFQKKLPHCDKLFSKYLGPWYPENERPKMTRPDMYIISGFQGQPLDLTTIQYLPGPLLAQTKEQLDGMISVSLDDYQDIIESDHLDLSVLDAVDKYYDRKKVEAIIKESDPKDFSNLYLVSVCEFGAMLGSLFAEKEGFGWLYSDPYFYSIIVHRETGFGLPVFDWGVKKFCEYGIEDGFVAKFNAALSTIKDHQTKKS